MNLSHKLHFNIIIFVSWIVLFILQQHLIFPLQEKFLHLGVLSGSLVFFPHGLRIIACMTSGLWLLPGLFLGHMVTGLYFMDLVTFDETIIRTLISLGSVILPYYLFKLNDINIKNLLILSVASSILNSLGQTLYVDLNIVDINNYVIFTYLIGDLLGAFSLFYFIKYIKYLYINKTSIN